MKHESPISTDVVEYEKPVIIDLEDVVAGCGVCGTGGGAAKEN